MQNTHAEKLKNVFLDKQYPFLPPINSCMFFGCPLSCTLKVSIDQMQLAQEISYARWEPQAKQKQHLSDSAMCETHAL